MSRKGTAAATATARAPRVHKGWERGKPRKLPSVTVRRVTISLCQPDLDRMLLLFGAHPELASEGDAIRFALEVAARGVVP